MLHGCWKIHLPASYNAGTWVCSSTADQGNGNPKSHMPPMAMAALRKPSNSCLRSSLRKVCSASE